MQYDDDRVAGRGHLRTDPEGRYCFWAVTPTPYPIPDDGPVGALLRATGRSPMRASHLHLMVVAPGCRTLVTHVFPRGDPYLESDSVFGVRDSLVVDVEHRLPGTPTPDGREVAGPWSQIRFDLVLAPEVPAPGLRSADSAAGPGGRRPPLHHVMQANRRFTWRTHHGKRRFTY